MSGPLSANLTAQAQNLSGQSAIAAQGAALALQAGVQANPVALTASEIAGASSDALIRGGALSTAGSGFAFAFQLTVLNSPQGPSPLVLSGVVAYEDASDAAFAVGVSPGSPIPPAVGFILLGGTGLWEATAGQVSAQIDQSLAGCGEALPSYITACNLATFTNAGFSITASTPFAGGGTGPKMAGVQNGPLVGVALTLDCSQTTLCGAVTSVAVSVTPPSQTVAPYGTYPFAAHVTGTSNTAVTWSIEEGSTGGTVSSSGLYTAPPTAGGPYHVVATSVADPAESGSATVTVGTTSSVYVTVTPAAQTVAPDGTQSFVATVTGASDTAVTWTIEQGSSGGSISSTSSTTGLYTAPATDGSFTVVATSVADSSAFGTATVTVSGGGSGFVAYWYGPYSIMEGSTPLSGNLTLGINESATGFYMALLCVAPNFVQATLTSPNTFTILPGTCPLADQTCATASLSFTGGTGTLSEGMLTMTFEGSINGLSGTACGVVTDFSGSFGPAAKQP